MTELRARIEHALKGERVLVLRGWQREALDALSEDMRTIAELGAEWGAGCDASQSRMRIRFPSGGVIQYIGGSSEHLSWRVRGLAVDFVDGASLLPEFEADLILRRAAS